SCLCISLHEALPIYVFIKLAKGPKPLLNISKEYINDIYLIYGTMKKAGYDCYLVGGCIRDMLLNREPKDYDFSTNATPEQVKERSEEHTSELQSRFE